MHIPQFLLKNSSKVIITIFWISISNCDLSTPSGKILPQLFQLSEIRTSVSIATPEGFAPTPITKEEKEGIQYSMNALSADGYLRPEAIKTQLEGIQSTVDLFNSSDLQESLNITGPIPGYTAGMTFREYTDYAIGEIAKGLSSMPKTVLSEYRIQILVSIAKLRLITKNCDDSTESACDELNYIIEKYLVLRELIIDELKKKIQEEAK
ncbi:hypothetical protein [Leptospira licerasiae]|uniref:hypothetical protein n=1 Tax=Leptospira licerasiae TaxID=447106 RepID=UPI0010840FE5|nr:hypothetical protein [Leptospira licerasiae]TGM88508.1 hypothetical protein EHR05_13600 [Leptospira licerasiae]